MPQEIERKFLISSIPYNLPQYKQSTKVFQGHLSTNSEYECRISNRLLLTTKKGSGLTREEIIISINQIVYDTLLPLTIGKQIEKERFYYKLGKYIAEMDIYTGKNEGLITVEVEFPNEVEVNRFCPPKWFGREVTGEEKYKNSFLAK